MTNKLKTQILVRLDGLEWPSEIDLVDMLRFFEQHMFEEMGRKARNYTDLARRLHINRTTLMQKPFATRSRIVLPVCGENI